MNRDYRKWWSPALSRDMELLVFGSGGTPVLVLDICASGHVGALVAESAST